MATDQTQMVQLVTLLDQVKVQGQEGDSCCHDEPLRARIINDIEQLDIPPIVAAVATNDVPAIKTLLNKNPYVSDTRVIIGETKKDWETILHTAVRAKASDALHHLLSRRFDANALNGRYETPLLLAVRAMDYAIAKLLLEYRASPDVQPGFLHLAFQLNEVEDPLPVLNMLALLVAYGGMPANRRYTCSCGSGNPLLMFQQKMQQKMLPNDRSAYVYGLRHTHAMHIINLNWNAWQASGVAVPKATHRI